MESKTIEICLEITRCAGLIIKEHTETNTLNIQYKKGPNDPVTDADFRVQTLAIKALRHNWPEIQIVGEESTDYLKELGHDYAKFRRDLVNNTIFQDTQSLTLDLKDVVVWIDPLDGTSSYVKGQLSGVTTLIGLSLNAKAHVGIIGKYYDENEEKKYDYNSRSYFSHVHFPHVFVAGLENDFKIEELNIKKPEDENRLFVSNGSSYPRVQKIYAELKPEKVGELGGLGNNVLASVIGEYDMYCYPGSGASRWDICSCEAIIKSIGGCLTDLYGNNYEYIISDDVSCKNGVIACSREITHKKAVDAVKKALI